MPVLNDLNCPVLVKVRTPLVIVRVLPHQSAKLLPRRQSTCLARKAFLHKSHRHAGCQTRDWDSAPVSEISLSRWQTRLGDIPRMPFVLAKTQRSRSFFAEAAEHPH